MPILNKLTGAFPTALIYITAGTLIAIWTLVYWAFNTPETRDGFFWVVGFLLTGLSLLAIGLLLGKIGRAARSAELPPAEVTPAAVRSEQTAAAHPAPVVPVGAAIPQVAAQPAPAVSVGASIPQMADVIKPAAYSDGPTTLLKTD